MRLRLLLLPALLLLGSALPAQMFADKISWSAKMDPVQAAPGERVTLTVTAFIEPGFHIYGLKEPTGPTQLLIDEAGPLSAQGEAAIPDGEEHDAFGMKSYWLAEVAVFEQSFQIPVDAEAGAVEVKGRVGYTICDDLSCDPPTEWGFTASVEVAGEPVAEAASTPLPPLEVPMFGLAEAPKVFLDAKFVPETARPGERVTLEVTAFIDPGWHIYGSKEELGEPTRLEVDALEALSKVGQAGIPPGKPYEALGLVNYWIADEAVLRQTFDVPLDAGPGSIEVTGQVPYTPCTDTFCLDPAQEAFFASLTIELGDVRGEFAPEAVVATGPPPQLGADNPLQSGLWLLIATCIGGGLLALAMPCTYPMIPITFSFFTKQADVRGGKVLPLALAYGAGIVVIFVLIGLLIGPVIISYATHWLTNMVLALGFAFFALVLFGLVNLRPPQFLNKLGDRAASRGGYVGVFLMGLTLVFATFTCTVPVLGGLLAFTGSGEDLGTLTIGMAVFGLTMALPFVLLSLVPGKIKTMPRSGEWMHILKVSLGFIELAAALKFLSQADVVSQWGILPRELFLVLWGAIFFVLALFLLGMFRMQGESQAGIGPGRMTGALAVVAFSFYCLFGALGYRLDKVMTAIVPPYRAVLISGALPGSGGGGSAVVTHTIVADDHEKAVADAIVEDKLVLINFTGFS